MYPSKEAQISNVSLKVKIQHGVDVPLVVLLCQMTYVHHAVGLSDERSLK